MPPPILVAGLDARSLLLEVPLLVREGHTVESRPTARALLLDIVRTNARLVALGSEIPDLTVAETVRRIRASSLTRGVSVLVLLPASTSAETEEEARDAGANAVLRRPLDPVVVEAWAAKLLAVTHRVDARVPVQAQVVGSSRAPSSPHFLGVTRNVSANGMLLASPVRLDAGLDLDLEFVVPGIPARLRGLGRVVREAGGGGLALRRLRRRVPLHAAGEPRRAAAGGVGAGAVVRPRPRSRRQPRHPFHAAPRRLGVRDPAAGAPPDLVAGGDPARPARRMAAGGGGPVLRGRGHVAGESPCARRAPSCPSRAEPAGGSPWVDRRQPGA